LCGYIPSATRCVLPGFGDKGIYAAHLSFTLGYELSKSVICFDPIVRTKQRAMTATLVIPLDGESTFVADEPRGGWHCSKAS
jgi:hypothetical protein